MEEGGFGTIRRNQRPKGKTKNWERRGQASDLGINPGTDGFLQREKRITNEYEIQK